MRILKYTYTQNNELKCRSLQRNEESYLTAGRDTYRSWPIVVEEAQFVAQTLNNIRLIVVLILQHQVMHAIGGAKERLLWHQEEIVRIWSGNVFVHYGSGCGELQVSAIDLRHRK